MAAGTSKANQRQASRNKAKNKNYGLKRVRMHDIPLICLSCGRAATVPSAQAYRKGGNKCRCRARMRFDTAAFPKPQVVKR